MSRGGRRAMLVASIIGLVIYAALAAAGWYWYTR